MKSLDICFGIRAIIKPRMANITQCTLDEKSAKHLSTIPLSNET